MLSSDTILQGRYRIVRQLGQGGMGAVYEAVDQRLDTTVALKETLFTEEKLRKQFEREARLLARLHHQALPRVSDHFNEGDGQFLVMQYVPGDDLFAMLASRRSPFPQADVLLWGDQLCDALDYLHTQDPQIIHRDIKPQNLKVTERGQIVLLDFGLAKGSVGQMSVVTTSASIFGYTPNYAPLEQVQGLGTDPRSDIYSLAATLYHLMTNVKPPDALSRAGAIVNGQPDPLQSAHTVVPGVTSAVASVLSRGMAQKRDDRYPSAPDLRASLLAAAESAEALAEAETVLALASSDARTVANEQQTRLMGEAKTVTAGNEARTLIATDAATVHATTAPAAGETVTVVQRAQPRSGSKVWLGAALLVLLLVGVAGAFYAYRSRQGAPKNESSGSESPTPTGEVGGANGAKSLRPAPATEIATPADAEKNAESKSNNTKTVAESQRPTAEKEPADNPPKPPKPETEETSTHDSDRNKRDSGGDLPPPPRDPSTNQRNNPNPRRTGTGDDTQVRTFPNGRTVVTKPDGTRIVTFPNGTTRVIPPGQQPNRRRPGGPDH